VLWLDEIEKALSSGDGDSGTSRRVLGAFLTWLAEQRSRVFIVATANDITALPPELVRKGRFDEIFFVDLPTAAERTVIFRIHLTARLKAGPALGDLAIDDALLERLVGITEGFTGAEIEQAVISACFDAFDKRQPLQPADLEREIVNTVPLAVTQAEQIAALRAWADVRAVSASAPEDRQGYTTVSAQEAVPAMDPGAVLARGGRPVDA